MEQQFIGVIGPQQLVPWTQPQRRFSNEAWFENDSEQLRLFDVQTPSFRSPLRYIGAKYRSYQHVMWLLPAGTRDIVAPFAGGCSLELMIAASGIQVYAYDNFAPVMQFFEQFNQNAAAVIDRTLEIYPIYRDTAETRERWMWLAREGGWDSLTCPIDKAAHTWAMSKQTYYGFRFTTPVNMKSTVEHFRPDCFERSPGIAPWREWHNPYIQFACADFRDALSKHPDMLVLADPPYVGKSHLYGVGSQDEFPHAELRDMLVKRPSWILLYGDDPLVWDLYTGYDIRPHKWYYRLGRGRWDASYSSELLIVSHDIAEKYNGTATTIHRSR